jgi:aldehyde dehydrogenase (NAD+)
MLTGFDSDLFIDGRFVPAEGKARYPNVSPVTEEVIGHAADASAADMERAIGAARRAFDTTAWSQDRAMRLEVLGRFRNALRDRRQRIGDITKAEVGAPTGCLAGPQRDGPLSFLDYPLDLLQGYRFERDLGIANTMGAPTRRLVWKEAAGVVAAISPWNVPIQINLAKAFPALAAGCTVVLKPAPETPWSAAVLAEAADAAGLPPGVLNVVTGQNPADLGEQLVTHPAVDMVSFTGSTQTGRRIMAQASATIKKLFLELGGKSANILLDDADFTAALTISAFMVTYHAGQGCSTPSRLLVSRRRHDEAVAMLKAIMEQMPFGDPDDPNQFMGPLISARQRERVLGYVEIGRSEGARLVTGGGRPAQLPRGFYVEPTLFDRVDNAMRIAQEEIFGPVLVVIPYDDEDDAVRIANDSIFGLSGAIHTADQERALRIIRRIRTGTFTVGHGSYYGADAPFGGYKQSGLGREMGQEGFEEYLQTKTIGLPA